MATVYQFCNGQFGREDYVYVALSDDGEVIASHISSGRGWGIRDTGPNGFYRAAYEEKYGMDFESHVTFVVCADGEYPPAEVHERYRARTEAS